MPKLIAVLAPGVLLLAALVVVGAAQGHDAGSGCNHHHDGTNKIICNDGDNTFSGTDGRDIVYGNGGKDSGDGHGGDDEIHGGGHSDTLRGSGGRDDIFGGGGNTVDRINGGWGADDLIDTAGLPPFSAPSSHEIDIVCAGVDDHLDFINVKDGDTEDEIYIDRGEDDYRIDTIHHQGFAIHDLIFPANECPISE